MPLLPARLTAHRATTTRLLRVGLIIGLAVGALVFAVVPGDLGRLSFICVLLVGGLGLAWFPPFKRDAESPGGS